MPSMTYADLRSAYSPVLLSNEDTTGKYVVICGCYWGPWVSPPLLLSHPLAPSHPSVFARCLLHPVAGFHVLSLQHEIWGQDRNRHKVCLTSLGRLAPNTTTPVLPQLTILNTLTVRSEPTSVYGVSGWRERGSESSSSLSIHYPYPLLIFEFSLSSFMDTRSFRVDFIFHVSLD